MSSVTAKHTIDASPSSVWPLLSDFGNIKDWNPNLANSYLLEGTPKGGVGAERQCDLKDGKTWIRERITEWTPGESMRIEIYEGNMPLRSAGAFLAIRELPDGKTEASMTLDYEPKFGILGTFMDMMMMRRMMRKSVEALLVGLASRVEMSKPARAA